MNRRKISQEEHSEGYHSTTKETASLNEQGNKANWKENQRIVKPK